MKNAIHTNMESVISEDVVDMFKQNIKFMQHTDHLEKRNNVDVVENLNFEDKLINDHKPNTNQPENNNIDDNQPEFIDQPIDPITNENVKKANKKFFLIKDFTLLSRFTKLFPHLFVNSALDWTRPRLRMITKDEALKRILYNYQGI